MAVDTAQGLLEAAACIERAAGEALLVPSLDQMLALIEDGQERRLRELSPLLRLRGVAEMMMVLPLQLQALAAQLSPLTNSKVPGLYMLFAEHALTLLCEPEHSSSISADPSFQAAIAQALLLRCLPAAALFSKLPLQMATQRADTLRQLLQSSQLSAVAKELLQQLDTGTQAAAALGSLLASLPDQLPEGDCGSQLAEMVKQICALAEARQPAEADHASHDSGTNGSTAGGDSGGSTANGVTDGDGSGSDSSPEASCSKGSEEAASSKGSGEELLRAAWGRLALQAFPKLAAALRLLAGSAGEASVSRALATVTFNTLRMLQAWEPRPSQPVTPDDFATWAAAATAGLRLQPLLSQLDGTFQQMQLPHSIPQQAACLLSDEALLLLDLGLMPPLDALLSESSEAAAAGTRSQLLQLHSLACRLCHWLVGSGVELAAFGTAAELGWHRLRWTLARLFFGAWRACSAAWDAPPEESRTVQAVCVTHLAATQALWAAAASAPSAEARRWCSKLDALALLLSYATAAEVCGANVPAASLQPVQAALAPLAQTEVGLGEAANRLCKLTGACANRPHLACSLVSTGLLAVALDCAGRLAAGGRTGAQEQAKALLHSCSGCLEGLAAAPRSSLVGASRRLGRQVAAAQSSLRQQLEALRADATEQSPSQQATQLRQLLPAAELVAAAFDSYCRRPSQQAAARLEVARVAVRRTCAYLRCPNLQAEGGALVCKGDAGLRCSACHVAWYCGTACSHADWREGGHRSVCTLLSEERLRRKAARALAHEQ